MKQSNSQVLQRASDVQLTKKEVEVTWGILFDWIDDAENDLKQRGVFTRYTTRLKKSRKHYDEYEKSQLKILPVIRALEDKLWQWGKKNGLFGEEGKK